MKISLLMAAVVFFHTAAAEASCGGSPDINKRVVIEKIEAPVFNGGGEELIGCLLHAKGTVLGYSTDVALCTGALGKKRAVTLSRGCCDTGSDFGDAECVARPKTGTARANGMRVHLKESKR